MRTTPQERRVKKVEWFLPQGSTEDWKTSADLFQYLHPSLFPDLNRGLYLQVTNINESPETPVTVHGTVLTAHLVSWKQYHSLQDVGFTPYPEAPLAETPHGSKAIAPLGSHTAPQARLNATGTIVKKQNHPAVFEKVTKIINNSLYELFHTTFQSCYIFIQEACPDPLQNAVLASTVLKMPFSYCLLLYMPVLRASTRASLAAKSQKITRTFSWMRTDL